MRNKGITIIALVITIIVMLILAGVTLNLTIGENGIFSVAKRAKEENIKAQLKEELEMAILEIETNKLAKNEDMKREDLSELISFGAIMENYEIPAIGEYKSYSFEVDKNYKVTIGAKLKGVKPNITIEIQSQELVPKGGVVIIKVGASVINGTITSIEAINGAVLDTEAENTDSVKYFKVTENGTYCFNVKTNAGRVENVYKTVDTIVEIPKISIQEVTHQSFKIAVTNDYSEGLVTEYKYYVEGILQNTETITEKQYLIQGVNADTIYENIYVETYFAGLTTGIKSNVEKATTDVEPTKSRSLLEGISKINATGYYQIKVDGKLSDGTKKQETYNVHLIYYSGDLELNGVKEVDGATILEQEEKVNGNKITKKIYEFGNKNVDIAIKSGNTINNAINMVVLKVNGNLTINENVILTACKSDDNYGGPKGMTVYCTETIINNGKISMTQRGARAEGQDVFLWRDDDRNFEYVPKDGANGANGVIVSSSSYSAVKNSVYVKNGEKGSNGIGRQTGRRRFRNG